MVSTTLVSSLFCCVFFRLLIHLFIHPWNHVIVIASIPLCSCGSYFLYLYQGEEEKIQLTMEIIERLVQRPEDFKPHAAESIKAYKDKLLKMFEVCILFCLCRDV